MSKDQLLMEGLAECNIPVPDRYVVSNGFMRWGKNKRFWLREIGEGYIFGDFVEGLSEYRFPDRREPSRKEWRKIMREKDKYEKEQRALQDEVAKNAFELWDSLPNASPDHQYLVKKQIEVGENVKQGGSKLVVPLQDIFGQLTTLQFIDIDGTKKFFLEGRKKGSFYKTMDFKNAGIIYLCEGYATGMSLDKVFDAPVAVCFDAGNMKSVAIEIRKQYPDKKIVICADNDLGSETNTGLQAAFEATRAISNASVIYPLLVDLDGVDIAESVDFNDVFVRQDLEVLRKQMIGVTSGPIKIRKSQVGVEATDSNISYE